MTSDTQQRNFVSVIPFGWETTHFFLLDLDRQVSLEDVKKKAIKWGMKYKLGNCLVDHSSDDKQLTIDLTPLQNYRLIYGRRFEGKQGWTYQQQVLREIRNSGVDIRYVDFREMEQTSTLWVSPKSIERQCPQPVAYLRITGENDGIREYLKMLWVGREISNFFQCDFNHVS